MLPFRHAVAGLIAILAAGCQPAPPLMSPLESGRRFGYAERSLGEDRFEVAYTTPRRLVTSFSLRPTDADADPVRSLALDLALWHAAEICRSRGCTGLRVLTRDTVVDSHPEPAYGLPEFAAGPWPYLRSPAGVIYGGTTIPSLSVRARATVTVQLLAELAPDAVDAAATIARMRSMYPTAEPPPAATSPRP